MPTYEYDCEKCQLQYDIIKSIKVYDGKDQCPTCGNIGQRIFKPVLFYNTGVQDAEFNIGLGKVTKNAKHREELAKKMGMIEIGNEKPEVIHKKFDNDRSEKLKKSWDEV